jgi:pimeloyl-ACP methyl ester carboxylesterase
MLALAYAAEHPEDAGPLVIIGCGTFDVESRKRMHSILEERMDESTRNQLAAIPKKYPDPDAQLMKVFELNRPLYDYNAAGCERRESPVVSFDMRAHKETWQDMLKLQEGSIYPSAFSSIKSHVLMLHGAYDPHPGRMIRDSLTPHLPQLEYRELDKCGHRPWIERAVRNDFFVFLKSWLMQNIKD